MYIKRFTDRLIDKQKDRSCRVNGGVHRSYKAPTKTTKYTINVSTASKVVDDFESLTVDLYEKYETQVRPGLDAINLPAYFGGITLKNKTLESLDLCQLIASLRNTNSRSQYLKGLFNIILIIALYPKLRL